MLAIKSYMSILIRRKCLSFVIPKVRIVIKSDALTTAYFSCIKNNYLYALIMIIRWNKY